MKRSLFKQTAVTINIKMMIQICIFSQIGEIENIKIYICNRLKYLQYGFK